MFFAARNNVLEEDLIPGGLSCLDDLRSHGAQIGAISNGNADVFSIPLFRERFHFALNPESASVGSSGAKPSPVMFHAALKLTSGSSQRAVHVGDSIDLDVTPAKENGWKVRPTPLPRHPPH